MARSSKTLGKTAAARNETEPAAEVSQVRRMNRLKDDVYREMLLLEMNRPGAERGLALALLRAMAQSQTFASAIEFGEWLETVCPLGLRLIEEALGEGSKCRLEST